MSHPDFRVGDAVRCIRHDAYGVITSTVFSPRLIYRVRLTSGITVTRYEGEIAHRPLPIHLNDEQLRRVRFALDVLRREAGVDVVDILEEIKRNG